MAVKGSLILGGLAATALIAGTFGLQAQQAPPASPQAPTAAGGRGGGGRGGGGVAPALFTQADANKDGAVTRAELMTALEKWFADSDTAKAGSITPDQLLATLNAAFPAPAPPAGGGGPAAARPTEPKPEDLQAMLAALPGKAPAKPAKPRKVLVLTKTGQGGFWHQSIPLTAKTVEALGTKTKAWSTTITVDAGEINTENLKLYDAVVLDSTTGCFLDEPGDKAATDARRAALLAFVRGGKGLAGIHAATDSYHNPCPNDAPPAGARAGGAGAGRGGFGPGAQLGQQVVAQADKNTDQKLSLVEMTALANTWFDQLDADKAGKVSQTDFASRFAALTPAQGGTRGAGRGAGADPTPRPDDVGSWPEFNKMIGGFFKSHWNDPQVITVKIDDPKSPLTAMFKGQEFEIHDETYTFVQDSFSRDNVHVLTSVSYAKMSEEDKAKEGGNRRRTDGDYALSYIRRDGQGRVFYEAHGHSERIYKITPMLEHYLAGIQYAIGDLKADDRPSGYGKK